tara:strand:+ start:814 stop:1635 length:822 start_codon:yes stop_codon:yes gene_type:complete
LATFAIGDIHGALEPLERLLSQLHRDYTIDALWFVGDLVNRGPDSAGVIRRIRAMGETAVTVLGNHDLALLGLMQRPDPKAHADSSLHDLIEADDADILLDWLRHRPLMHDAPALGWTMVHAGIAPEWTTNEALARAQELEVALRAPDYKTFLRELFGNKPARWAEADAPIERYRFIANALTRIRFVERDGSLDMKYKKTIHDAPKRLVPWFAHPARRSADTRFVFGHWSALDAIAWPAHNVWGIDTGAAWNGRLTAMRLDTPEPAFVSVAAS